MKTGESFALTDGSCPQWMVRLRRTAPKRRGAVAQAVLFTGVGGLTTGINAVLYLLLRNILDTGPANLLSLLLTTLGSTAVHRRMVFTGMPVHRLRLHLQSAATLAFYCVSSAVALALLHLADDDPGSVAEAAAVAAMSVFGGVSRFALLRLWVFQRARRGLVRSERTARPVRAGERSADPDRSCCSGSGAGP